LPVDGLDPGIYAKRASIKILLAKVKKHVLFKYAALGRESL
jgi:hypothetical protein